MRIEASNIDEHLFDVFMYSERTKSVATTLADGDTFENTPIIDHFKVQFPSTCSTEVCYGSIVIVSLQSLVAREQRIGWKLVPEMSYSKRHSPGVYTFVWRVDEDEIEREWCQAGNFFSAAHAISDFGV